MLRPSVLKMLGLFAVAALVAAMPLSAQTGGTVTGRVTAAETAQPLGAVQVFLDGTGRGSITRADGTFTINDVPPGTYTVVAQSIGYQQLRRPGVQVTPGATATVNLELPTNVLSLQEIVVTGLVDPVEGARSPITVAQVTREQMPVPVAGSAATAIQGKVAGATMTRTTGLPGSEVQINLRTPTSARGSNQPLMVVDGVILGSSTVDIESMDIESVEVIKGAAAASLYGSRAAAGVIAITTVRGRGLAAGQTQFSTRAEFGSSFAPTLGGGPLPTTHAYLTNAQGQLINNAGQPVSWGQRVLPPVAFMDKQYTVPVYDNLRTAYRPGDYNTQNFGITSNHENTNLAIALNRYKDQGALEGHRGYDRNSFRVNLDHRFRNTVTLGISGYHARAYRDELISGTGGLVGGLLGQILAAPVHVDLSRRDENGNFLQVPDPTVDYENPLWRQNSRDNEIDRARTLGNLNVRWSPISWFTGTADVSFDREDADQTIYVAKGVPSSLSAAVISDGELHYINGLTDTFNGSLQGSLRRDFGPLNIRTTVRGVTERADDRANTIIGRDFLAFGVPRINAAQRQSGSSSLESIRSLGYLWDTAFDYDGKYILTVLGRRDGSSLFGPDNRWHNYYRVAGAYRLTEEPWFNLPGVDEFKLKASRGTAGGRPQFNAQYETWTVNAEGISKGALGNRNLRPEHTTENEIGIETILFGRVGVELVHARQTTTDQLVLVPLPAATGYNNQWQNSGTMQGQTTELSIEARVINRPGFTWTTNFVGDRSRSRLTEWPQPCQTVVVARLCEGANIKDIWAFNFLRQNDQLPASLQPFASQFQVNDEGYWVWVGEGNTFRDGIAKNLWGRNTALGGYALGWGLPFLERDAGGNLISSIRGNGDPDFQLGWMNTLRYAGFSLHGHLHTSVGNELFNHTRGYSYYHASIMQGQGWPGMDQTGKEEGLKKPILYYTNLYQNATYVDAMIEPASYLKLRTLSLSYNVPQAQLGRVGLSRMGVAGVDLSLIGRNLFTVTNYSGFDPEVIATQNQVQQTPYDNFNYPNLRNYTFSVGLTF